MRDIPRTATVIATSDLVTRAIERQHFLPAVTKHLKLLERAQLIHRGRNAQWRPCRLKAAPLKAASDWIEEQRQVWEARLDRLEDYLHTMEPEKGPEHE